MVAVLNDTRLLQTYERVRRDTEDLCRPLRIEDYVVQPVADVSPPKWHIGHTTWFFETFVLKPHSVGYQEFNPNYNYVFNSYYETVGARVIRTDRGNLSRPTVEDVFAYRQHVDHGMRNLLSGDVSAEVRQLVVLGLNHEQQHQELLWTDIKYILGHNPLFPPYDGPSIERRSNKPSGDFVEVTGGIYDVGAKGDSFCFDNELGRHKVLIGDFAIQASLVTNAEFLEFVRSGGYQDFRFWHSEGWEWVKTEQIAAPLYWYFLDGQWCHYTLEGLYPVDLDAPVCHVSYYEAAAFAAWKGLRLPTEFEWEVAASLFEWGQRWEWTGSAYLPYPGFVRSEGAIGEYNGKFMVNQMVLRGGSVATPANHSRITYRNFFHAHARWQYTGIRLAR